MEEIIDTGSLKFQPFFLFVAVMQDTTLFCNTTGYHTVSTARKDMYSSDTIDCIFFRKVISLYLKVNNIGLQSTGAMHIFMRFKIVNGVLFFLLIG